MLSRLLVLALSLPVALSTFGESCASAPQAHFGDISSLEFSNLVNQISEDGGYFWSNNYISNETSYQHVLGSLATLPTGGVYVGVGPNQNFTYIAATRPDLAFIVDIRRQNLIEHLLFKTLLQESETREEYLSRLLGRPRAGSLGRDVSLEDLVSAIEETPPDGVFFEEQLDLVLSRLRAIPGLDLTRDDVADLRQIYREFFHQGFGIKYDSWRSFFFPSLKEFMLESDLEGNRRNWLASAESYDYVREMELGNRIIPVVGDFAGNRAFRRLGRFLASRGATVSTFYVSNVEFYLFRQDKWADFVANVEELPTTESSVFIRAYANLHRPHPKMVGDHITVSLVQNIHAFLRNARAGRYKTLWDVVTIEDF
jgi:hypothetical protein